MWIRHLACEPSGNNSVVECDLAKVEVAGSNPVSRSNLRARTQAKVARRSREAAKAGCLTSPERFGWQAQSHPAAFS
jgi:hypothetical protein